MMTAISARSAEIEAQVEAYRAALLAAGMYADHPVGSVARAPASPIRATALKAIHAKVSKGAALPPSGPEPAVEVAG